MTTLAQQMRQTLETRLTPSLLEVFDESAAHAGHSGSNGTNFGTHFRVQIASPFFIGKRRVAQHRLVYDALQEFIDGGVHALAIEVLQANLTSPSASSKPV